MVNNTSDRTELVKEAIVIESSVERLARARALDREARKLRDELQEKWFDFAVVLHPIWQDSLWRELGYKNWTDYIDATLHLPVTTVSNYLLPWRKLLQSGLNPEQVRDVPLSRVSDLATLARANDGNLDPDILEQAKTARTRPEVAAFRERVSTEKERLGIEPFRTISLLVTESLYDLFRDAVGVVAKMCQEPQEKKHEALALEMSLVAFLDSEEARATLVEGGIL